MWKIQKIYKLIVSGRNISTQVEFLSLRRKVISRISNSFWNSTSETEKEYDLRVFYPLFSNCKPDVSNYFFWAF